MLAPLIIIGVWWVAVIVAATVMSVPAIKKGSTGLVAAIWTVAVILTAILSEIFQAWADK